jgi:hypothetical protein
MTSKHLIQLLLKVPALTNLVGNRINSKKEPQWVDIQADGPYLTIRQTAGGHEKSTQGRIGLQNPLFSLTAYALTTLAADQIIDVAGSYLDGLKFLSVTAGGTTIFIKAILQEPSDDEDWLPSPHMEEVGVHTAGMAVRMWCTEEQ